MADNTFFEAGIFIATESIPVAALRENGLILGYEASYSARLIEASLILIHEEITDDQVVLQGQEFEFFDSLQGSKLKSKWGQIS